MTRTGPGRWRGDEVQPAGHRSPERPTGPDEQPWGTDDAQARDRSRGRYRGDRTPGRPRRGGVGRPGAGGPDPEPGAGLRHPRRLLRGHPGDRDGERVRPVHGLPDRRRADEDVVRRQRSGRRLPHHHLHGDRGRDVGLHGDRRVDGGARHGCGDRPVVQCPRRLRQRGLQLGELRVPAALADLCARAACDGHLGRRGTGGWWDLGDDLGDRLQRGHRGLLQWRAGGGVHRGR